jgi:phosphinothricin acetyltransferase
MRGQSEGRTLYGRLLPLLAELGYCQPFAGVAPPDAGIVGLHEALGSNSSALSRRGLLARRVA